MEMMRPETKQSLQEKSDRVDRALEAFLYRAEESVENLHDAMLYALGLDQPDRALRGKRIRPALCLVACEALGGPVEAAVPFAMAIELMHNFFLVHDDIQDGDAFRRGRASVWTKYGVEHAINIGDYLFVQIFTAFRKGSEAGLDNAVQMRLLDLLLDTLDHTHAGQALDMNALDKSSITLDEYLRIVNNKTGYYLAAPIIGGAIIAGANPQTVSALRAFGRCVGPVFQIVDDTIDLTEGKGRESVGSDIREGKRSYLVAHACGEAAEDERRELMRILDLPRAETTAEHIAWVRNLFEQTGAIQGGRAYCRQLMEQARQSLAPTPAKLRDTLLEIFEYLLERKT